MEHKKNNKNRKKREFKNNQIYISSEYILIDETQTIKADFKTLNEALKYKENHSETDIYMLTTYKIK